MANVRTAKTHCSRRQLLAAAGAGAMGLLGPPMLNIGRYRVFARSVYEYSARTLELMGRALVIDMLSPVEMNVGESIQGWVFMPHTLPDTALDKLERSQIDVIHPALGIGGPEAPRTVERFLGGLNAWIAAHPQRLRRIDSVDDLEAIQSTDATGVLLGVQNSDHFRAIADVAQFHSIGQRVSQLTYNTQNLIGSGATERVDAGLSDFGVGIVEAMNRAGMAIDVSHCGDRTTLDAFEASRKPVLITHSNCRALVPDHARCKPDEAIRHMARSQGAMGITSVRHFVRDRDPTTVEHVLDHVDHVVRLVGIDYVGIGTDSDLAGYDALDFAKLQRLKGQYKGSYGFRERQDIEGLDHPLKIFDLTEGLIRRGYSDANIELILGGNFKRALGAIWNA